MNEIILPIKAITKASSNKIGDLYVDAKGKSWLKIYVTSVPENGKANLAIIKLLAKEYHLPKSNISIILGKTDNYKIIKLQDDNKYIKGSIKNLDRIIK
jgi:uncharacterized protein YggU (UPF0235/DUF167 family)